MKVSLYLSNKIMNFLLPPQIAGSYSFDCDENEEIKLINIEARNGSWVLYSTEDVTIITDKGLEKDVILNKNSFYILTSNNKNYLIYVSDIFENSLKSFKYNNDLNLIIGNSTDCTLYYNCEYIKQAKISIHYKNNELVLENKGVKIYINEKAMNQQACYIQFGDRIHIYGLEIMFLPNFVLINNPNDKVVINKDSFLNEFTFSSDKNYKNIEVKDRELYDKDSYFSKSPRIRRVIEEKTIKLDPPPKQNDNEDLPFILTIGPMLTMGVMSVTTLCNTIFDLYNGEVLIDKAWPQLVTGFAMLASMLVWPLVTRFYNKNRKKKDKEELENKYNIYLMDKRQELISEQKLQKEILIENLLSIQECLDILKTRGNNFWNKRVDQNDFLVARIGMGDELLKIKVEYPEEGFTIEESDLRKKADAMVEEFKYIKNVPIGYSFYENKTTAIMGNKQKSLYFVNNIILQLITFYSYNDLKIVVFTNEDNKDHWEYLKYLNHTFTNNRDFRFFATTTEDCRVLADYLNFEVNNRLRYNIQNKKPKLSPYYLIIVDDYDKVKNYDFIKQISEEDDNFGFSLILVEERLSKLPSKCSNFIYINESKSGILKNSYENQEQIFFQDEINYKINMMSIAKILSNIPIEFAEGMKELPNSITFLEMEKAGKVEQLNILNRWNSNDSTESLRAEIGVDEEGQLMYLDLHEKYHGPHGLIAGMTGSGKSEFIITYILSMAINYSPDDVAFILIDYKGGGLAFAFENKTIGILPHLAGTITNLDKAEMDRTLVSIDSEVKRRQEIFNNARDTLGESTIDIYKYQKFFKEGKLEEAIPHLFIICDEFAELKSQQPDFMDNLISVARIGRSLGVHLILATQKPSGVVNEQIWSNSKFRVCLKVQDEQDSKEMLKRPEAASLKQTGRFYLQVGYDEYFALGQSAWCGAKYYPSDKIVRKVDKSVNFIGNVGNFIKSVQSTVSKRVEAKGEQLAAIMNSIIETSNLTKKRARRLWLENIADNITLDYLENKYEFSSPNYLIDVILGEYDAPERQEQGLVKYNYLDDGNSIIYGTDGNEKEAFLQTLIYSTVKDHTAEEINFYIIDFGSESLRLFYKLPQMGGMVFAGEDEKFNNLLKLLRNELKNRKKLLVDYGGEYKNYIEQSGNKIPLIVIILNNWDSILENNTHLYDDFPDLVRDSERYGIIYIFTCTAVNSIHGKVSQNCHNSYAFHMKDSSDYNLIFNLRNKIQLRDISGRGLVRINGVHEFQTALIKENNDDLYTYLQEFIKVQTEKSKVLAKPIPTLPEKILLKDVLQDISTLSNVPVGITKNELETATIDMSNNMGTVISSNRLSNTTIFVKSFLVVLSKIVGKSIIIFDATGDLVNEKVNFINYFNQNFEQNLEQVIKYFDKLNAANNTKTNPHVIFLFYGFSKIYSKFNDVKLFDQFLNMMKKYEKANIVFVEESTKMKQFAFESWYVSLVGNSDAVWIGRGIVEQSLFRISNISKEMSQDYKNDMGFVIYEGLTSLCKLLEFNEQEVLDDK